MSKPRIYLDTSVISAHFDLQKPVRQLVTQKWIENEAKSYELYASELVVQEVNNNTHPELRDKMARLLVLLSPIVLDINEEVLKLAATYRTRILPREVRNTIHIAAASHSRLDAIVSWNFRHIVNLKTIKAIHDSNQAVGLPSIQILTLEHLGGARYGTL